MQIVLASGSPRRKELLEMLGLENMLIIPAVGEERAPEGAGPEELVKALSAQKAMEIAAQRDEDDVIIGADTIVWVNGQVFGKPHSEEEAAQMLRVLSGNTHEVYTGVTVIKGDSVISEAERSLVHFRPLSEAEISAYIATKEPMDKAGAYGAQGKAALFVRGIEGDFFNVMGLPLCRLGEMLKKQGVIIL